MKTLASIASQAVVAPELLSLPHLYDAAPTTTWALYLANNADLGATAPVPSPVTVTSSSNKLVDDARQALRLTAPIGLNIARLYGLAMLVVSNPVGMVLGGVGALLTGKQTLDQLKNAFVSDPAIRRYMKLAEDAIARNDLERAEDYFRDALAVNVDPENRRNAELYLQMGMLYVRMGRPRQALLAFARASVLFKEGQSLPMQNPDGKAVQLSARGLAEMMAVKCLDAFAIDDAGLDEWSALASEFSVSAILRLENFLQRKEDGFWGIFKDPDSAAYNRSALLHIRFLQEKFATMRALKSRASEDFVPDIRKAIDLALIDETLDRDERGTLLVQQSQFYFRMAAKYHALAVPCVNAALDLVHAGEPLLADRQQALALRSEIMAWISNVVPSLPSAEGRRFQARLPELRAEWQALADAAVAAGGEHGLAFASWAQDQLYRSASTGEERLAAIRNGGRLTEALNDPSWELQFALRHFFSDQTDTTRARCLAAAEKMAQHDVPVMRSYGLRYLGRYHEASDPKKSADFYLAAAAAIDSALADLPAHALPFLLQGRTVLHSPAVVRTILQSHAAYCLSRAHALDTLRECINRYEVDWRGLNQPLAESSIYMFRAAIAKALNDSAYCMDLARHALAKAPAALHAEIQEVIGLLHVSEVPSAHQGQSETTTERRPLSIPEFSRRRHALRELILELASALQSVSPGFEESLNALVQRLDESRFEVVIAGEFSTGKSTFINAMLGEKLLPSAVRPTTAVIVRIAHGPKAITIRYTDGRIEQIEQAKLKDFVTEKLNPGNKLGVSEVQISAPVSVLADGIVLLDTPGVGSLIEKHTATAATVVAKSDAVIMLADASQPLSKSERDFLQSLTVMHGHRVFVLANKIDDLGPSQAAKALAFIRENAEKILPGVVVYPMAAYWALVSRQLKAGTLDAEACRNDGLLQGIADSNALWEGSRFGPIEDDLFGHLAQHKGAMLLESVGTDARRQIDTADADCAGRIANLEKDLSVVKKQVEQVLSVAQQTTAEVNEHLQRLEEALSRAELLARDRMRGEKVEIREDLLRQLDNAKTLDDRAYDEEVSQRVTCWLSGNSEYLRNRLQLAFADGVKQLQAINMELQIAFQANFESPQVDRNAPVHSVLAEQKPQINLENAGAMAGSVSMLALAVFGPVGLLVTWGAAFAAGSWYGFQKEQRKLEQLRSVVDERLDQAEAAWRTNAEKYLNSLRKGPLQQLRLESEAHVRTLSIRAETMLKERDLAQAEAVPVRQRLERLRAQLGALRMSLA